MDNVFCHIVGLNNKIKDKIIELLKNNNFNFAIIDLDNITQVVLNKINCSK